MARVEGGPEKLRISGHTSSALPPIDEHEVLVRVPAEEVWPFVIAVFERVTTQPAFRTFARVVRCKPDRASGAPDTVGATLPGFRVERCTTPTEWALAGEHIFSRDALTFRVTPLDGGQCRVGAESSGVFPGRRGAAYRCLLITTGGHLLGVCGILLRIKTCAERSGI